MQTSTPVIPVINLNGTSRVSLVEHFIDAMDALRVAQGKLGECRPHGRDYPDPDKLLVALAHHRIRMAMIDSIVADLDTIALAIR